MTSEVFIPEATTLKLSFDGRDDHEAEILGQIVRIGQCAGVGHLIHLEFFYPCPDTFFERAIGVADRIEPASNG